MKVVQLAALAALLVCSLGWTAEPIVSDEQLVPEVSPSDMSEKAGKWSYQLVEWNGEQYGMITYTTGRVGCETKIQDTCRGGIRSYLQVPWLNYQRCSYSFTEHSGRGSYTYSMEASADRPTEDLVVRWIANSASHFSTSSVWITATLTWLGEGADAKARAHFCNVPRDRRFYYYVCGSGGKPKCESTPKQPWPVEGPVTPMPPKVIGVTGGE